MVGGYGNDAFVIQNKDELKKSDDSVKILGTVTLVFFW
jgi:glutathionylspermidine synthase